MKRKRNSTSDHLSSIPGYMGMIGCLALALEPEDIGHLHGLGLVFTRTVLRSFWRAEGGYYAPCHTYLVFVHFIKVYLQR
jgi:hypothetical protein